MRKKDRETTADGYNAVFDKLSIRWGLVSMGDQFVVRWISEDGYQTSYISVKPRPRRCWTKRRFSGCRKSSGHGKQVKDCTACLASGEKLIYQLPSIEYGKLKKLTEPGGLKNKNRLFNRKFHKTAETKEVIKLSAKKNEIR